MVSKASEDFPEPDRPDDDYQLVARQVDVDILEVVDARAAHGHPVMCHYC